MFVWISQVDAVVLLLRQGATVSAVNRVSGATPLHTACQFAGPDVVSVLLSSGAHAGAIDAQGNSPLHITASECVVTLGSGVWHLFHTIVVVLLV